MSRRRSEGSLLREREILRCRVPFGRVMTNHLLPLRVYPSSHTNPVFIILDGKPIHELKSAEWCRKAVDQCWKMKQGNIRAEERSTAGEVYNKARKIYDEIIKESSGE